MNGTLTPSTDDELGARIARAIDHAVASAIYAPPLIELATVRRGARRRRARRTALVGVAVASVVAAGVVVLAQRQADPSAADVPQVEVPVPPAIGAAAVLPDSYGDPVSIYASAGGQPRGMALPRVDVWLQGERRIVVRTYDPDLPLMSDSVPVSTAPATTAPGSGEGHDGPVLRAIDDDDWVAYLTDANEMGSNVVLRGMDERDAQAALDELTVIDGVLRPAAGYELAEHADAVAATQPAGWFAMIGYGGASGETWAGASPLDPRRDSIELATSSSVGTIERIAGREVFVDASPRGAGTGHLLTWIDPAGVLVWVNSRGDAGAIDRNVVSDLALVNQARLESLAEALSARLSTKPVMASATVGGFDLSLRGQHGDVVMCIRSGTTEQCAADGLASSSGPPIVGAMDTIVEGKWVAFGAYGVGDEGGFRPDLDTEDVTLPSGDRVPVTWLEHDGYLWWVLPLPAGTQLITTDWTSSIFGVVGTIARPVVVGSFG